MLHLRRSLSPYKPAYSRKDTSDDAPPPPENIEPAYDACLELALSRLKNTLAQPTTACEVSVIVDSKGYPDGQIVFIQRVELWLNESISGWDFTEAQRDSSGEITFSLRRTQSL